MFLRDIYFGKRINNFTGSRSKTLNPPVLHIFGRQISQGGVINMCYNIINSNLNFFDSQYFTARETTTWSVTI